MPSPRVLAVAIPLLLSCVAAPAADDEPSWRDRITFALSERVRGEFVGWFRPPPGTAPGDANRYVYMGNQARAGIRVLLPWVQLVVDAQHTQLVSVPDDASLAPPQGNLGPGAIYFANTHSREQGELFLKQGFLAVRRAGFTLTGGRFDHREGLETVPGDPTLAQVKRMRIAERLVGPFDFTHVTRSFDGVRLAYDAPAWNATALAVHPTFGGFEVSANREIDDIDVAGLTLTAKRLPAGPPADLRLFYLYYGDGRRDPVKVDNRPLPVREDDRRDIVVHSAGAHAITAIPAGPGTVDLLGWLVLQAGDWGVQDHAAWAFALEAGYQLTRVPAAPWLRVGWNRSSGDDDPRDGDHATFFQLLPTARIYALLPFYNLMNLNDVFAQLLLRPHQRLDLRFDVHRLHVTEGTDLWYSGGGATNDTIFGFAGAPAHRRHGLAWLVDVSTTVSVLPQLAVSAYYGHAFGGGVVGQTFAGRDADYGFLELVWRYP